MVGAGAGLSASAGLTYSGERFRRYFGDFQAKYGIRDMYSGGFYPFKSLEEYWAWWSRQILVNRYEKAPEPVYEQLLDLVVPILLCVPAPAGGGNSKKIFEPGNTKSNWGFLYETGHCRIS